MVQMNSSFDADGPPFSSWRVGYGFGKVCRSYINDPSLTVCGRDSPSGEGYYRENRFHKKKWDTGQINSLGVGDRPDYGNLPQNKFQVSPDAYGDVSKKLDAIKKSVIYADLKIKPRFKSIEQKIADNPRHSGPGPAKYDTRYAAGQSGVIERQHATTVEDKQEGAG